MNAGERHSQALEAALITDPDEIARQEAQNGLRQFDLAVEQIEYWLQPERKPYRLRPSHIMALNRSALEKLNRYAGVYRPTEVEIHGSKHTPPGPHLVAQLVEELCDYVNANGDRSAIHLASYVMWRLNWVHPFVDGNGRTTRVTSFVVMCVRLGYRVPGSPTIPDLIAGNKTPYYEALEKADIAHESGGVIDVSAMEKLLSSLLARQLTSVFRAAQANGHSAEPSSSVNP
ncbi:MAG TPA: Fic family protein [Candidatus Acidoferrales bacterium]|jgi:Fic family protein|nr:Fic family protein [Candidatus Acidoferrales bacterium]